MSLKLTKMEIFYLADIAWFLKGYVAKQEFDDPDDFGQKHLAVMSKVIADVDREEENK